MSGHWASEYIGRGWEAGAEGPVNYDCYGLVRHIQKRFFNRDMEYIIADRFDREVVIKTFRNAFELKKWKKIDWGDNPVEGDIMILSRANDPIHIGVLIKHNGEFGILHSDRNIGVIFTPNVMLPIVGWFNNRLYRWIGDVV